ncbi:MAG: ABC transporter permease [Desulfurococcaceae archaeon]
MVSVYRVYAISMIYALWILRNKLFYFYLTVLFPLTILVPFLIIAPARLEPFIAVGTVILTLIYCFSTASQDLALDRLLKRIAILLTKPITPLEYFLGILLSNSMQTLPAAVIVTAVLWAVRLIRIESVALLLLGLVAGWYILTTMGYITALILLSRDYNTVIIVSNSIAFILTFVAPVYYPLELLPEQLIILAYLIPTTHIANIIGKACSIEYGVPLTITYTYLLTLALLLTAITLKSLKLKDIY